MSGKVDVVVGLQFGSEGKGRFAAELAAPYELTKTPYAAAVRAGGPNAGHTLFVRDQPLVVRHLPAAVVNPNTELFIGPGAALDLDVLEQELLACEAVGLSVRDRLMIDPQCVIVTEQDREFEHEVTQRIGSTGKGGGSAWIRKASRTWTGPVTAWDHGKGELFTTSFLLRHMERVIPRLHSIIGRGANVLAEGTQGALLSLDVSYHWPHVTAKNVTATALLGELGLSCRDVRDVYGVARTFPIRVGGPSGAMGEELDWPTVLANLPGYEPERTTVTGRQRRIAKFDRDAFVYAARMNGCTGLCFSFLDYLDPLLAGRDARTLDELMGLSPTAEAWCACRAVEAQAPLVGASWGPDANQTVVDRTMTLAGSPFTIPWPPTPNTANA